MDKLSFKPYHKMTRIEAVVALRELHIQFSDYKFRTDQVIRDLQGALDAMSQVEHVVLNSPAHDVRQTPRPSI